MSTPSTFVWKMRKAPILALLLVVAAAASAQSGRKIKPGFNLFSKEQDIQLGKDASAEIEKQVELAKDRRLNSYIEKMGSKLAAHSQDSDYPFTFKVVAAESINAFALPGGPIYVHSGLLAAADNEAQLAGVTAHEIGHVVLRHSTHQASKAQFWQIAATIGGDLLGAKGGLLGALGQMGIGFGVNSVMLKYSRSAEKDADIVGARMMAAAGYNPVEMARFFEKLKAEGGASPPQFFSDHPNPGNRVKYVSDEIRGYPRQDYVTNTAEFRSMKARAAKIKPTKKNTKKKKKGGTEQAAAPAKTKTESRGGGRERSAPPGMRRYAGRSFSFLLPEEWKAHETSDGAGVTALPENGLVRQRDGGTGLARGLMAGLFDADGTLQQRTSSLIEDLQASNPELNVVRGQRRATRLNGRKAESVFLQGRSPLAGEQEYVWLLTAETSEGLFYMLLISPESEYNQRKGIYERIVGSLELVGQVGI